MCINNINSCKNGCKTNLFDASVWIYHNLFDTSSLQSILMTHLSVNAKTCSMREYNLMDLFWWAKHVQRGNANRFIQSVHPREQETRWDIKLTDAWVDKMKQSNIAFSQAWICVNILKG